MPPGNIPETLFSDSVSKRLCDALWGRPSIPPQGGRRILVRLSTSDKLKSVSAHLTSVEPITAKVRRYPKRLIFCRIECLVTLGRAFYNPPNTALDIVGMSIRQSLPYRPTKRIDDTASECLSTDTTSASPRSTE